MSKLRVLVGCEESGVVRRAFLGHEHEAFSCDLLPARDDSGWHIQADIFDAIKSQPWELIILHPPCQYIAVSGNRWYAGTKQRSQAQEWTQKLWNAAIDTGAMVCLENTVGLKLWQQDSITGAMNLYKPQWIQPWQFGHPTTKKSGLWLHGLPDLEPTDIVTPNSHKVWKMGPSPTRSRDRATTYLGIADAMAEQWGRYD